LVNFKRTAAAASDGTDIAIISYGFMALSGEWNYFIYQLFEIDKPPRLQLA
jgi:hypothetical protein